MKELKVSQGWENAGPTYQTLYYDLTNAISDLVFAVQLGGHYAKSINAAQVRDILKFYDDAETEMVAAASFRDLGPHCIHCYRFSVTARRQPGGFCCEIADREAAA